MKFLLWGRILNPALITLSTRSQRTTAAWQGLVPAFSAPKRARTLVWERRVYTFICYTEVKPAGVNGIVCGRNIHDCCPTKMSWSRHTHPNSFVIQSKTWLSPPLWLGENMAVERFKGWKCQRWSRRGPCVNQCSAWVKGCHVAVNVRVGVI